jgi:hypothetical protein
MMTTIEDKYLYLIILIFYYFGFLVKYNESREDNNAKRKYDESMWMMME